VFLFILFVLYPEKAKSKSEELSPFFFGEEKQAKKTKTNKNKKQKQNQFEMIQSKNN